MRKMTLSLVLSTQALFLALGCGGDSNSKQGDAATVIADGSQTASGGGGSSGLGDAGSATGGSSATGGNSATGGTSATGGSAGTGGTPGAGLTPLPAYTPYYACNGHTAGGKAKTACTDMTGKTWEMYKDMASASTCGATGGTKIAQCDRTKFTVACKSQVGKPLEMVELIYDTLTADQLNGYRTLCTIQGGQIFGP
jgi:hypothetical protein